MDMGFAQRRRRDLIIAGLFAILAALMPLLVKDVYVQNIMVLTLMYAALSQSWNILSGYCGQISLGHALYFGLGAYTTTLLFTKFGVLPWFGMLGGGLISALIAMALGYPCFRLRGHYFVIATIVIAEIALLLFQNWDWAGAALGIDVPVHGDSWLKFQFTRSKLPYFYFALALACIAWLVTWWLEDSKWGYWWRAVKDNPDAAESLGVVVFNSKMGAAAVSAFLTAVGGAFYAQFVSYIDPESVMGFQFSLLMALPAVLGGIGTLWGPVLGAIILIPLTELTRSFIGGSGRGVDLIVYGALIVLISLARPEGLVGLFSRRRKERSNDALARNPRRLAAFFRPDRQQRHLDFGWARRDRRTDRPQRRRQVDAVQSDRGRAAADARLDPIRRRGRHALPAAERCQRGIARTFQVVKSFETMTVIDNVIVGALMRNTVMREARRKAHEVLEFSGLAGRADVLASELIPSEKRRLEVARALATEPKLLLLDEVLTGLTPIEAQTGVELVRKVRATGVTVLMVEHVMEIVMPLVDRAIVLDLGKVLVEGKPADIVRDPKVISAYLGDRHAVGA